MLTVVHRLSGPVIEVTIVSSSGETGVWTLPKAILSQHSVYFQHALRSGRFKESEVGKVTIYDFEPDIFKLFIQHMLYGRYITHSDNSPEGVSLLDNIKAWVLGDYLTAVDFQNFAARSLYAVLMPAKNAHFGFCISSAMVKYCYSKGPPDSPLVRLLTDSLIRFWNTVMVDCQVNNRVEWEEIWNEHPDFRNELLFNTANSNTRTRDISSVEKYLVTNAPSHK